MIKDLYFIFGLAKSSLGKLTLFFSHFHMDDMPLWLQTKIPKEKKWAHGQELKKITHVFVLSQNPSKNFLK
jgi:hypothetical protein